MVRQLDRDQERVAQPAEHIARQRAAQEMRSSDALPTYALPGDGLSMGASLGNAHCWINTKGSGDVQSFFDTDVGRIVMDAMLVRFSGLGTSVILANANASAADGQKGFMQLLPAEHGTTVLHPAYQQRVCELEGKVHLRQTTFVPKFTHASVCAPQHQDLPVAYQLVELTNRGTERRSLQLYGFVQFRGDTDPDIRAHYHTERGVLLASNAGHQDWVRVFGATVRPSAYETSTNAYQIYRPMQMDPLTNRTHASGGYVLGALQVDVELAPGERREVAFIAGFSARGEDAALGIFEAARDVDAALERTIVFYEQAVKPAEVLTPDAVINDGALWAKVNMLRVMADYPTGPAFTNNPSQSSAVVGRDAFWFVLGADYLDPKFSCHLLRNFATRQGAHGQLMEFYDAVTGKGEDNDLNINDNTPLFILAVEHHWRTTGHRACLEDLYLAVVKAARCIVDQENAQGLVWCTATGEETRGIIGWRNIIPHYRISGAVTEVNVECAAALRAAGHLAENLGHQQEAREFREAGAQLTEAINRHLLDPRTRFYYLNIDVDGSIRTDVTADEVFPVIFGVAPPDVAYNIVRRINSPDFLTSAGVRTAAKTSAEYDPAGKVGLVGGVWPGMTWWYAFAAARYHPGAMVRGLRASFEHYAAAPLVHNTVPGQFSEWFDGDSLVNRGMRLSPWEAPRYVWAAVQGVCGALLQPPPQALVIQPLLPMEWKWVGLRHLPFHDTDLSYFVARLGAPGPGGHEDGAAQTTAHPLQIFTTGSVESLDGFTVETYASDVTDRVGVVNSALRAVAFERPGELVVCVGNTDTQSSIGALELDRVLGKGKRFTIQLYVSELGEWVDLGTRERAQLERVAVAIDSGGFSIARVRETR
jgi:glycogen debranching enzyme